MGKLNNANKYSVVVLAAGIGQRLDIENFDSPKCLLKIHGKTLIQILLEKLMERGFSDINMIVGFKNQEIIEAVNNYKKIPKVNFIKINNYSSNGHGLTLFKYKNKWSLDKKPIIMLHADLYFDWRYFDEVVSDKNENILGLTTYKFAKTEPDSLAIGQNKVSIINAIHYKKNIKNPLGQVLCINKISAETTLKLFSYMNNYFKQKDYKKHPWEIIFNNFINQTDVHFFANKQKDYPWFNINRIDDYIAAKSYNLK